MSLRASLPMYAAPHDALAAFWDGVRRRVVESGLDQAPERLDEPSDLLSHWRSPNLLLSQTCGLPFSTALQDDVVLVGVPHYSAPGCEGPLYRSVIVVRRDDPARSAVDLVGRRVVVNGFDSHSGFSQLAATLAPFAREALGKIEVSGGHLGSMALVREGAADFAAIDCVTWALAARDEPDAVAGLKIITRSEPSLGLPFIASRSLGPDAIDALRGALASAMRDPALADARAAMLLAGVSFPAPDAYHSHAAAAEAARDAFRRASAPRHEETALAC